jgi:hypothetical protein
VAEISLSGDDIQFYLVGVSLYAPKIDTEIRAKVASNARKLGVSIYHTPGIICPVVA